MFKTCFKFNPQKILIKTVIISYGIVTINLDNRII